MTLSEIQPWVAGLISANPTLAGVPVIQDDGDFDNNRKRNEALQPGTVTPGEGGDPDTVVKGGLAVTVWRIDAQGVLGQTHSLASLELLVAVVIEENVTANRSPTGFQIPAENVAQEVVASLLGKGDTAGVCRLECGPDPIANFGKSNGVLRLVVLMTLAHPIAAK